MNRLSFLFIAGLVAVLVSGAFVGYTKVSEARFNEDLKRYNLKIANLENEVVLYEGGNFEAALSAKEAIDFLKGDYVKWSQVVEDILATTPKDSKTRIPLVDYISYSGSQGNRLSVSARTNPESKTPYYDVARLIKTFSDSNKFKRVFVPAISPGVNRDGELVLAFNFNVEYVPVSETTSAEKSADESAEESVETKPETSVQAPKFAPVIK